MKYPENQDGRKPPEVREATATYMTPTDLAKLPEDEALAELRRRNRRAVALLRSLRQVDEEGAREQRETFEILRKALGEDRPSYRKLF